MGRMNGEDVVHSPSFSQTPNGPWPALLLRARRACRDLDVCLDLRTEPLADHRGDAVAAHCDAVEGVGDFHGAFLVRDDDQLAGFAQFFEDGDEPAQVGVIKRGLDLVHDVEGRGPCLEDGHQQRHGRQGAFAAGKQREPLDFLAGRAGFDLDAGGEHVGGVGQDQPALAAGEQPGEDADKLPGGVLERLGKDLLDAVVDFLDDVQQVLAAGLQVFELGAEELVALLKRGELLERQRVDLAQGRRGRVRRV